MEVVDEAEFRRCRSFDLDSQKFRSFWSCWDNITGKYMKYNSGLEMRKQNEVTDGGQSETMYEEDQLGTGD